MKQNHIVSKYTIPRTSIVNKLSYMPCAANLRQCSMFDLLKLHPISHYSFTKENHITETDVENKRLILTFSTHPHSKTFLQSAVGTCESSGRGY